MNLPFRENGKPTLKKEFCIGGMGERKSDKMDTVLLLRDGRSGWRSEKFWLVFELLKLRDLMGEGIFFAK